MVSNGIERCCNRNCALNFQRKFALLDRQAEGLSRQIDE